MIFPLPLPKQKESEYVHVWRLQGEVGLAKNGSSYSFTFRQFICTFLSVSCAESPHTTALLGLFLQASSLTWNPFVLSGGARSCLEFNLPSPQNTNTCYCTSVPTWGTALSTAGQWSCYLACGKHYPRSRWFCGCWICATIKGRPLFHQWKYAEFLRRFQAKEGCFINRILYIGLNIHTFGVQGTGYKTASTASPFDYN